MIEVGQLYQNEFEPGRAWQILATYDDRVWVLEFTLDESYAPQWHTMMAEHFEQPHVFTVE